MKPPSHKKRIILAICVALLFYTAWDLTLSEPDILDEPNEDPQHAEEKAVPLSIEKSESKVESNPNANKLTNPTDERTITSINESETSHPKDPMESVKKLVEASNFPAAVEILESLVKADPSNASLRAELAAILLYRMENAEEGYAQFRKAFELDPNHGLIAQSLVDAGMAAGKHKEVEALLRDSIANNPNGSAAQFALSELQLKNKDHDKAIRNFEKIAEQPGIEGQQASNALAFAHMGKKDFHKSAQYFEKVIEQQINSGADFKNEAFASELIGNMGFHINTLIASRQPEKARSELGRLLELYPDHPEVKQIEKYYSPKLQQN